MFSNTLINMLWILGSLYLVSMVFAFITCWRSLYYWYLLEYATTQACGPRMKVYNLAWLESWHDLVEDERQGDSTLHIDFFFLLQILKLELSMGSISQHLFCTNLNKNYYVVRKAGLLNSLITWKSTPFNIN